MACIVQPAIQVGSLTNQEPMNRNSVQHAQPLPHTVGPCDILEELHSDMQDLLVRPNLLQDLDQCFTSCLAVDTSQSDEDTVTERMVKMVECVAAISSVTTRSTEAAIGFVQLSNKVTHAALARMLGRPLTHTSLFQKQLHGLLSASLSQVSKLTSLTEDAALSPISELILLCFKVARFILLVQPTEDEIGAPSDLQQASQAVFASAVALLIKCTQACAQLQAESGSCQRHRASLNVAEMCYVLWEVGSCSAISRRSNFALVNQAWKGLVSVLTGISMDGGAGGQVNIPSIISTTMQLAMKGFQDALHAWRHDTLAQHGEATDRHRKLCIPIRFFLLHTLRLGTAYPRAIINSSCLQDLVSLCTLLCSLPFLQDREWQPLPGAALSILSELVVPIAVGIIHRLLLCDGLDTGSKLKLLRRLLERGPMAGQPVATNHPGTEGVAPEPLQHLRGLEDRQGGRDVNEGPWQQQGGRDVKGNSWQLGEMQRSSSGVAPDPADAAAGSVPPPQADDACNRQLSLGLPTVDGLCQACAHIIQAEGASHMELLGRLAILVSAMENSGLYGGEVALELAAHLGTAVDIMRQTYANLLQLPDSQRQPGQTEATPPGAGVRDGDEKAASTRPLIDRVTQAVCILVAVAAASSEGHLWLEVESFLLAHSIDSHPLVQELVLETWLFVARQAEPDTMASYVRGLVLLLRSTALVTAPLLQPPPSWLQVEHHAMAGQPSHHPRDTGTGPQPSPEPGPLSVDRAPALTAAPRLALGSAIEALARLISRILCNSPPPTVSDAFSVIFGSQGLLGSCASSAAAALMLRSMFPFYRLPEAERRDSVSRLSQQCLSAAAAPCGVLRAGEVLEVDELLRLDAMLSSLEVLLQNRALQEDYGGGSIAKAVDLAGCILSPQASSGVAHLRQVGAVLAPAILILAHALGHVPSSKVSPLLVSLHRTCSSLRQADVLDARVGAAIPVLLGRLHDLEATAMPPATLQALHGLFHAMLREEHWALIHAGLVSFGDFAKYSQYEDLFKLVPLNAAATRVLTSSGGADDLGNDEWFMAALQRVLEKDGGEFKTNSPSEADSLHLDGVQLAEGCLGTWIYKGNSQHMGGCGNIQDDVPTRTAVRAPLPLDGRIGAQDRDPSVAIANALCKVEDDLMAVKGEICKWSTGDSASSIVKHNFLTTRIKQLEGLLASLL